MLKGKAAGKWLARAAGKLPLCKCVQMRDGCKRHFKTSTADKKLAPRQNVPRARGPPGEAAASIFRAAPGAARRPYPRRVLPLTGRVAQRAALLHGRNYGAAHTDLWQSNGVPPAQVNRRSRWAKLMGRMNGPNGWAEWMGRMDGRALDGRRGEPRRGRRDGPQTRAPAGYGSKRKPPR